MASFLILGQHSQGLIASILLARQGHQVSVIQFPEDTSYEEFYDGCKTGPLAHIPLRLPMSLVKELDLENYDFEAVSNTENPFKKLPFYNGLKKMLEMFQSLDYSRPLYKEKAWRDAWGTFEIGRVLSEYDEDIQALFAKSMTLSLSELLDATDLNDADKADIMALCVVGGKTNPTDAGSAAAILPAMLSMYDEDNVLVRGSLHALSMSLKQSAMAAGVTLVDDTKIRRIVMEGNAIQSIIADNEFEFVADHYVLDTDPVRLFEEFLGDYSVMPSFKNRVHPKQNKKECVHVQIVYNGEGDMPFMVAPSVDYIEQAKTDMKADGGSQDPILSIADVTKDFPQLGAGQRVFSIVAQYFEPDLDNEDAILQVVYGVLEKQIDGFKPSDVVFGQVVPVSTQFGQPTFNTAMPLLQLFKVFSGHHAIAYDMPIENAVIAGYGRGTASHYHTFNGGARIATLYSQA